MAYTLTMTTMTPITEILRNCTNSGDFGDVASYDSPEAFWERVITTKAADSGFGHLVESYLENGWLEGSTIGWNGSAIRNGHHRLVMAILLGLDEVPTVPFWGEQIEPPNSHPNSGNAHGCFEDPYPILLTDEAAPYSYDDFEEGNDEENSCTCSMCAPVLPTWERELLGIE